MKRSKRSKRSYLYKAALALALPALAAAQAAEGWERISGTWSGIEKPRQVVVQDAAAWQALWAEHARGSGREAAAPAVDFGRETVVGVFLGSQPTSQPVDIVVENAGDGVVVYAVNPKPRNTFGMQVFTRPFAIRKLAKAGAVRFETARGAGARPQAAKASVAEAESGLRDAVARVGARLVDPFGAKRAADTLAADGSASRTAKVTLTQLPPPPGQGQQGGGKPLPPPPGQDGDSRRGQGGKPLPPPPGQDQGGKPLPPPPGQGEGGKPLPPPPGYKPRPGEPGRGQLPPPPGTVPYDQNRLTTRGHWRVVRDTWGNARVDYGPWRQETDGAAIQRGGSETGLTQGTHFTADLASRSHRNQYVQHWRWVGRNCDPNDPDRCEFWDVEYRWFLDDVEYGRTTRLRVVVDFDWGGSQLLPWERERIEIRYDGGRVWLEYPSAAFRYQERGPIVDQQAGVATITLTPGARILRSPEADKVAAFLVNEGGRLKLAVDDARAKFYAGEALEVQYKVYRVEKASWRNPFGRDTKVAERTANGPERFTVDAANGRRTVDLGVSGSGEYYIDAWGFRRADSKVSSDEWVWRGKGNTVRL